MNVEIPIFTVGTHTAMNGVKRTYSDNDLIAMAQSYDPDLFDAPVVLGHPEHNDPAWGWVESLSFRDGALYAKLRDLHADFVGWVRDKSFKKTSASFYLPDSVGNPKPGTFYLRHIGFLGAVAPSLKNLPTVSLSETDGALAYERKMYYHPSINLMQSEPNQTINHKESNQMPDKPDAKELDDLKAKVATLETDNAKLKTQSSDYKEQATTAETALLDRDATAKHDAHVAFCEKLAADGRLLPANQAISVAALDLIAAQEKPLSFGEGDDKAELTVEQFKKVLSASPVLVDYGEVSKDKSTPAARRKANIPAGYDVDPKAAELHNKALAYQESHPDTDYLTAVSAVETA